MTSTKLRERDSEIRTKIVESERKERLTKALREIKRALSDTSAYMF
jgi:hypothetical protein